MSRIKSSTILVGEWHRNRHIEHIRPKKPDSFSTDTDTRFGIHKAIVPDIKRNAKSIDGYRMPSPYSLRQSFTMLGHLTNPGSGMGGSNAGSVLSEISGYGFDSYSGSQIYKQHTTYSGSVVTEANIDPSLKNIINHNMQQALRMKALNNLKDEIVDVAMVLAEIQSTATMASNLLYRIGRSMDAVRRRSPESFRWLMHGKMGTSKRRPTEGFLKETAGVYLEWKYGIMPTIMDLEGITRGLDLNSTNSLFDNPPIMVARSSVTNEQNVTAHMSPSIVYPDSWDTNCKIETTAKSRIDFRVSGEGLRGLSQYGIGLGTVATVLWDKTPFTFVLDMALPIADLIKAWTSLSGVDYISTTETYHRKYTFDAQSASATKNISSAHPQRHYAQPSFSFSEFERLAFTRPPMPLPFVRNPLKVGNISTVLALFTSLRSGDAPPVRKHGYK